MDLSLVEKADARYRAIQHRIAYILGNDEPVFDAIQSAWDAIESLMRQSGLGKEYDALIDLDGFISSLED